MKVVSGIAFLLALVMVGFQNCAPVGVENLNAASQKAMGEGDFNLPTDEEPSAANGNDATLIEEPTQPEQPSQPEQPYLPPVAEDPGHHEEKSPEDEVACVGDECIPDEVNEAEAAALCLKKHKKAALTGPEVVHVRGNVLVSSDNLTRVEDTRGHMVIKGQSSEALTKLIKNTRGAMVICGMTVKEMTDVRGNVTLVNSIVKKLSNTRGNIRLMNSVIENSSDIRGNVREVQK